MAHTLRIALRRLARQPGLTIVAIATLAVGIGASTAVFGLMNALVLRPLPVERPAELVFLNREGRGSFPTLSYPDYRDLRDRTTVLSGLVAYRFAPISLDDGTRPSRIWGYLATGNYFEVLGVRAVVGRTFTSAHDRAPGAHPVAVLTHGAWRQRFNGDPDVVGRTISLNGQQYTILGVTPPGFSGTEIYYKPEIFVPMAMQAQIEPGNAWLEQRQTRNLFVLGRLAGGVGRAQAAAALNAAAAELAREHPTLNEGMRIALSSPGLAGNVLRGPVMGFSTALLALAGLVLLLACANLTGVLVARAVDRQRETAICLALGAEPGRVVRDCLLESALLSAFGLSAALLLTSWIAGIVSLWRPTGDFPLFVSLPIDYRVFLFSVASGVVATSLVGIVPALQAIRADPVRGLKGEARIGPRFNWHLRDLLVVVQIALSGVLLVGSALVVFSLRRATELNVGFNPENAVSVRVDLALQGYDEERGRAFQSRVLELIRQRPGVESAGIANSLPLGTDQSTNRIYVEGRPEPRASEVPYAFYYSVTPGFFRTMQTRVVGGRDFDSRERRGARRAAIVNRTFAMELLGGEDAVGMRFRTGRSGEWTEIIGIVEDGKYQSLGEAPRPAVFYPLDQRYISTTTIVARTALQKDEALGALRETVRTVDPSLSLFEEGTLVEHLGLVLLPVRAAALVLTIFGAAALALATLGVHGLVSYSVARRIREISLRLAVGASRRDVIALVVGRTTGLFVAGAAAAAALALAGGKLLSPILFDVEPTDPLAFLTAGLTLALVTGAACILPARRALQADPATVLRSE
jgi:predicted permease